MSEQHNNLPLALHRAQMAFWMRTGELLNENRSRWLELAHRSQVRDTHQARVEPPDTERAPDGSMLATVPMDASWHVLNLGLVNARDLTLSALNSQAAFGVGMRRALAQWQVETAQALSNSRNAMPFSDVLKNLMQANGLEQPEPTESIEPLQALPAKKNRPAAPAPWVPVYQPDR